jgi:hypothetical protein
MKMSDRDYLQVATRNTSFSFVPKGEDFCTELQPPLFRDEAQRGTPAMR